MIKYIKGDNMKKGKVIVIEGACDGIGKTTQAEMLCDFFDKTGEIYIAHHFPSYKTPQGTLAEQYLKGEFGNFKNLSPYFINALFAIDRATTWEKELKPEHEKGKIILLDRYTTSSLIYQTALFDKLEDQKRFIDYVMEYEYNKLKIKEPDIVIFLTAPYEVAINNIKSRVNNEGIKNDIHETNLEYMKKVYETALFVAKYLSWDIIDCSKNNKINPPQDIHFDIQDRVRKRK